MKILSGIQPSGQLHIGNYFGMMRSMIANQERAELYAFIVNLHALTSVHDRISSPWVSIRKSASSGCKVMCRRSPN